eukprot:SM000062S19874  [mRNA]  locus=s62:141143:142669:+ [translate_table: standard]
MAPPPPPPPPPRRLEGKVAVVTASTAGIGLAVARRLGEEGAAVVVSSRKKKNVDEAVEQLAGLGINCLGAVCHVASAEQRRSLVAAAVEKYGRIDIFVSNAAVNPGMGGILDMSEAQLDKILEINIKAAILLVKDAAPHIPAGGSIVFVSSITAFNPAAPLAAYAISKTALLGLTKGLAAELAPDVRVNCVAPGIVATNFAEALVRDDQSRAAVEGNTMLGRLGKPSDMASAVAFLASDDASYITGETLVVAGGMQSRL